MSNVRYIDVNANNSIKNKDNNRWTYKINDGLYLPTGTQIEVANSLVNLPGIVGSSIEIEKDIDDIICFQYYQVDTTYQTPVAKIAVPGDDTLDYNALLPLEQHINPLRLTTNTYLNTAAESDYFKEYWGYSEVVMPLSTVTKVDTDLEPESPMVVPFCGQAAIFIQKGIYSISELSELITDQINRKVNLDDPSFTYINEYKDEFSSGPSQVPYTGSAVNNTTSRLGRVETPLFWDNYQADKSGKSPPTDDPLNAQNLSYTGRRGALKPDETEIPTIVAMLPEESNRIIDLVKDPDNYSNAVPNSLDPDKLWKNAGAGDSVYAKGYQQTNGLPIKLGSEFTPQEQENLMDGSTYNLFDNNAMAVGTVGFKLSYSADKAGFNINYCHQPRQIPTHDKRGNSLSNPGQEAVYMKRVPDSNKIADNFPASSDPDDQASVTPYPELNRVPTDADINTIKNTCNVPVSRTSGIMIYNFGLKTARNLATNKRVKDFDGDLQELHRFDEFFETEQEARDAWEETIWFRLGFTYDQLVNANNFETQVYYDRDPKKNYGFTTNAEIDPSVLPFQSTLYNAFNITAQNSDSDRAFGLPAVPSIQLFNLLDSNVPSIAFNNNKKKSNKPNVAPFEGSFYNMATMIPIQTTSQGLTAKNLPTLSKNGYMLVLSDIVDQNDYAGDQSELGIIDMVSKSSLSNQDFISDRQVLTHIISNPKSINYININIVNPDLTDISLEPNSTILLKLTFPRPKNTILIQNTEDNIANNIITQQTEQEFEQEIKGAQSMPKGSQSGSGDKPPSSSKPPKKRDPQQVREVKKEPEEGGGEERERRPRRPSPELPPVLPRPRPGVDI